MVSFGCEWITNSLTPSSDQSTSYEQGMSSNKKSPAPRSSRAVAMQAPLAPKKANIKQTRFEQLQKQKHDIEDPIEDVDTLPVSESPLFQSDNESEDVISLRSEGAPLSITTYLPLPENHLMTNLGFVQGVPSGVSVYAIGLIADEKNVVWVAALTNLYKVVDGVEKQVVYKLYNKNYADRNRDQWAATRMQNSGERKGYFVK